MAWLEGHVFRGNVSTLAILDTQWIDFIYVEFSVAQGAFADTTEVAISEARQAIVNVRRSTWNSAI